MDDLEQDQDQAVSKSEVKRQMTALQKLGEELVALPASKLDQLDLPEILRDAVNQAKRITAHGGLRRQMQYIGRLMRITDAQPIADQLTAWRGDSTEVIVEFHRMENWRTRLLADDAVLTEFVNAYPQSDAQRLRTLIRNARREAEAGQAPKSSRALFKLIRALVSGGVEDGNERTDEQENGQDD